MSDIEVIFVIPIPPSLTGRDKSLHSLSFHVIPLNRDVTNFYPMIFSKGCSRLLMLGMIRIKYSNFSLKPDVNAQYAVCG